MNSHDMTVLISITLGLAIFIAVLLIGRAVERSYNTDKTPQQYMEEYTEYKYNQHLNQEDIVYGSTSDIEPMMSSGYYYPYPEMSENQTDNKVLEDESLDDTYECLYCSGVFDREVVKEKGHCPSCGAPVDKKRL